MLKKEIVLHQTQCDDVLQWIAEHRDELSTPFYLYSERRLNDSVASYRSLFPKNSKAFYSLKANPQPGLVRHFSSLGLGAEIASRGEWQLCALADVASPNILVGGVSKSEEFISALCSSNPAAIVLESETEWRRLNKVAPTSHKVLILLRINPGVSFGGLDMAGGTQFGLSPEQALLIARGCSKGAQVDFLGLHFYFGSQRLAVSSIIETLAAIEETMEVFRKANIRLKVVALGLGCGVPYLAKDPALDVSALREQLQLKWQNELWSSIEIWSEAGRALVASAGYFIARVTERKHLYNKIFIFLDGGLNVHNPGIGLGRFFRSNPQFYFITDNPGEIVETVNIVGNLCTSADCLGWDVAAPKLKEGDLVVIPNSGAYCLTTGLWGFNSQHLFAEGILTQNGSLTIFQPQHSLLTNWV